MAVLIAALSGRALAAAARRAGDEVIVADLFADSDTRALAPCIRIQGSITGGLDGSSLLAAIAAHRQAIEGIVYGAGLEGDPDLLRALAEMAPLIGNPPAIVESVKDPFRFALLLARLGLPHPRTTSLATDRHGWLRKIAGGSGGTHIAPASGAAPAPRAYYQEKVEGRAVSALFLADGHDAEVLGFSAQWTAPSRTAPYRYGGCAAPLSLPITLSAGLSKACRAIAAEAKLVGLNSLDMLVRDDGFTILEINPRPGATLDVFDEGGSAALWRLHRAAVGGTLPAQPPRLSEGRAAAIVYAPARLVVPPDFDWPPWAADRSPPGTVIEADEPICTALATAAGTAMAEALAHERVVQILRLFSFIGAESLSS